ncbi:MAG: [FeFe] hydrogenase H-cluster radical SAM maturase HydG [Thermodesulfobacteriota bacterium]
MITNAHKPVLNMVEGIESLSLIPHGPSFGWVPRPLEKGGTLSTKEPSERELSLILKDAYSLKGLGLESAALLLAIKDARLLKRLYQAAFDIKEKVFGKRIVLFAPLYLSNLCVNNCLYCGFRSANKDIPRKALSTEEVVKEARALEGMGFKRILLVTGEDPSYGLDYIIACIRAVYKKTGIRIVHLNAPPMGVEELKEIKAEGVGVFQVFQETYHAPTYELMHPSGKKKNYDWRITVMDRAFQAGFDDVGIGALLGLYDFRFDALSAIAHSKHLYETYGTHAHTISIPRLRPAEGSKLPKKDAGRYEVSNEELKKIVSVYRLSVPSAGVVASTRESAGLRNELIKIGASQLSAASKTDPGGYAAKEETLSQFSTSDKRSMLEVMIDTIKAGCLPSLCTTCYRTGRVGKNFAEITSSGNMEKFCHANAVLTLKEYTLEHPLNGEANLFNEAITAALSSVKEPKAREKIIQGIKELEDGKRDVCL